MSKEKEKETIDFNFSFPIIKNIVPQTIAESIQGMTSEQTRNAMRALFEKIEKISGYEVNMQSGNTPIQVFNPNKED